MEKKRAKRGRIRKYLFISLLVYGVLTAAKLQFDVMAKRQELSDIQGRCESQKLKNDQLEQTLNSENENEYIERIARGEFGYAYPNERIYVDISGK